MAEAVPSARARSRRRRANTSAGPRNMAHKVMVNAEEEAALVGRAHAAGGITIPRLLLESALAEPSGTSSTERRDRVADLLTIRRLLSANSNNLNQIARLANAGEGIAGELPHTLRAIRALCDRIDRILVEEYAR